jgi:hypothetical protein
MRIRPLLLSYLPELSEGRKYATTYQFLSQIYEAIIQAWGKREAAIVENGIVTQRNYTKKLIEFSKQVAQQICKSTDDNLLELALQQKNIKAIDAQSRSLLTRNRETNTFEFTHSSFKEYFWAELFFDQTFREEDATDGSPHPILADTEKYPYTLQFYNEMCWSRIVKIEKAAEVTIDEQIVDLGSNQLEKLSIAIDINALFTLPNRQIRAYAIKHKEDLFIIHNNNQGFRLTNEKISRFVDISKIREPIEYGYQLIRILSTRDIKEHYLKIYFKQYNKALKANHPPLATNIFLNQFFEEIFDYLI